MTTIKVTNIQDTAGANSATTAQIYNGIARAWVNFNGTTEAGVNMSIRSSYNVASVTDIGTGNAQITFISVMPNINYAILTGGGYTAANNTVDVMSPYDIPGGISTSYFTIGYAYGGGSSPSDIIDYVCAVVYST
jgi:hypothetical protein